MTTREELRRELEDAAGKTYSDKILPCKHRGELTGQEEVCGCNGQVQPSYFCTSESVAKDRCLLRIGMRAKREVKDAHQECVSCEFRFPPEDFTPPENSRETRGKEAKENDLPTVKMEARPGDIFRAKHLKQREEALAASRRRNESPFVAINHSPKVLRVNQGAGGLGDAVHGMFAVAGLKQMYPEKKVLYGVARSAIPFLHHFTGCDGLHVHVHDSRLRTMVQITDMQLNASYSQEHRGGNRVDRYCENIGAKTWARPEIKDRDLLHIAGESYAGCVVISPFTSHVAREYPASQWQEVIRRLQEHGERVIVSDRHPERCEQFGCEIVTPPESDAAVRATTMLGLLFRAKCMIGADSGMAHLSGLTGTRTIVLCGQTSGERVFSCYENMTFLTGGWGCEACYWKGPQWTSACRPTCPSLMSINPARIVEEVERVASTAD